MNEMNNPSTGSSGKWNIEKQPLRKISSINENFRYESIFVWYFSCHHFSWRLLFVRGFFRCRLGMLWQHHGNCRTFQYKRHEYLPAVLSGENIIHPNSHLTRCSPWTMEARNQYFMKNRWEYIPRKLSLKDMKKILFTTTPLVISYQLPI